MSAIFFSHASNFRNMDKTEVDLRTGQFIVNIPFENLIGNTLLGPEFLLKLSYNPLDMRNQGFGTGFSLAGLTQFNKRTHFLELSNGETYQVEPGTVNIRHHPGREFRFAYTLGESDGHGYTIYWKNGRIEQLSTGNSKGIFVTSTIGTPLGPWLTLEWDWNGPYPLLTQINDQNRVLCEIPHYGLQSIISIWPGQDEGYQISCNLTTDQTRLERISYPSSDKNILTWIFAYDAVEGRDIPLLTGITHPTGMTEKVEYSSAYLGLRFPEGSNMENLPVVRSYIRDPGNNQPKTEIRYGYSTQNFLGYQGAGFGKWSAGEDYIYKSLREYTYSTSAQTTEGEKTVTLAYEYNNFHLPINEAVDTDDIIYRTEFTYYTQLWHYIDNQPAQFQYVQEKKESWNNINSILHEQRTQTEFDEYGNILRKVTPIIKGEKPGAITTTSWYAAEGEDGCPSEPNGFVRFMKEQTTRPMETDFDTPIIRICYTYDKLGNTDEVALTKYSLYSDDVLLGEQTFTYNTALLNDQYGRIMAITYSKFANGKNSDSFTSRMNFVMSVTNGILTERIWRTGHDDFQATSSYSRSALSGRILSRTDEQGVSTDYTYDKLGRILNRTDASGSKYSNSLNWSYTLEANGSMTTIVDKTGNKVRSYSDGAGQIIRLQQCNADKPDEWHDTFAAPSQSGTTGTTPAGADSTPSISPANRTETDGSETPQTGTDSTIAPSQSGATGTTPAGADSTPSISPANGTEADGSETPQTGKIVTLSDKRSGQPVKISWIDSAGKEAGTRQYYWDGWGQLRKEVDELNNVTQYTYDAYGRLLTQTLPDGTVISRSYAPHLTGEQVASINVTGHDRYDIINTWHLGSQIFDSLGRLTWRTTGGYSTRYMYDKASPMPNRIIPPSDKQVTYSYISELGNAVSSINTAADITQSFTYSKETGNVSEAIEGNVCQTHDWSHSGRLLSQNSLIDIPVNNAVYFWSQSNDLLSYRDITIAESHYERNSNGQIIKITDDDITASLKYDDKGRMSEQTVKDVSSDLKLTTKLTYDDFDREVKRTLLDEFGNGLVLKQVWRKNGQLSSRLTEKQNGEAIRREQYLYDRRNRLIRYTVTGPQLITDAYGQEITGQDYHYDALNNIIRVTSWLSDETSDSAIYFYENSKNPTQLTSIAHNHPSYPSRIDLEYDAEGRLIRDQARRKLTYDWLGRMNSSRQMPSGPCTRYKYDAFNRLVQITFNDEKRNFYYRGDKLVNEVIIPADSHPREKRFIEFNNSYLAVNNGTNLILTGTDQNGSLIWSRGRDATGPTLHSWAPYGNESFLDLPSFNSVRSDFTSGTYSLGNGYRTYNSMLMRFNAPDNLSPFGAGGINPYAYCNGDPINNIDPSGHMGWPAILGIVLGSIGLVAVATMAGLAVITAGGVMAALNSTSASTLLIGGLGVASDVAAISSGIQEDINPQKSAAFGWISLGLGMAGIGAIGKALMKRSYNHGFMRLQELPENISTKPVTLNGNMRNVDLLTDGLYTFTDTYKNANRLNIVAHGNKVGEGARLVVMEQLHGARHMDVDELVALLRSRYNLDDFANLRTIACHSGTGRELSFGARLYQATGIPVKSYIDRVTGNFEADAVFKLFRMAEVRGIYEDLRASFPLKRTFKVYKTNPFKTFDINRYTWSYKPEYFPTRNI